ncbi:hypothetical protein JST99_04680 [Candidatus Dependentiae bacterium]|nr:hypothetical protein [Candidatus Dependentiae bacterium]MCC7414654.1 hypothetical protein [Campylobacterota bacterium]
MNQTNKILFLTVTLLIGGQSICSDAWIMPYTKRYSAAPAQELGESLYCPELHCWQLQGGNCLVHNDYDGKVIEISKISNAERARKKLNATDNRTGDKYIHASFCNKTPEPDSPEARCLCQSDDTMDNVGVHAWYMYNQGKEEEMRMAKVGIPVSDLRKLVTSYCP